MPVSPNVGGAYRRSTAVIVAYCVASLGAFIMQPPPVVLMTTGIVACIAAIAVYYKLLALPLWLVPIAAVAGCALIGLGALDVSQSGGWMLVAVVFAFIAPFILLVLAFLDWPSRASSR